MSKHLTRLHLECVSFSHVMGSQHSERPNRKLSAICRVSDKQPIQFAFQGQSTKQWIFELSFIAGDRSEDPRQPVGTFSFEDGFGSIATGNGPRVRLLACLEIPATEWDDMWDMAARGVVPKEIFLCLCGAESKSDGCLAYNAWTPRSIKEQLAITAYQVTYQQAGPMVPKAIAAQIIHHVP
ncbi:MAG: hypothetical protein KDD84_05700 [Caldilineaceae bacterium]|nr:hypothetical protein [Caldilineaceae bacterium]